jgi:small subunit ribosomal protein S1
MFESSSASAGRKTARLEAGAQVEGTVLAVSGGLVIIDIGMSADANLDLTELNDRVVKPGDKIKATVSNPRTDGPVLTLSLGRGGSAVNTATLQLALEGGTPVSGTVSASNKGGFTVDVSGIRAFCPISQIDVNYVNDPETFVGQTLDFQVMEIKEGGRNVVISRRKLLQDERRQAEDDFASKLSAGMLVEGTISNTVRHGALVDLGGVEGFIPISELSRARIERAEDVVTIGETVKAQVLSAERGEKGLSIRLSLKALEAPGPNKGPTKNEILTGKVVKHVPNGVIVATEKGEGLVPTRELSLAPGADHRRTYPVETELRVVVVNRDQTSGKIRFSVSQVAQVEERNNYREFSQGDSQAKGADTLGSLGDLMSKKFPGLAAQAKKAAAQKPAPAKQAAAQEKLAPKKTAAPAPQAPAAAAPAETAAPKQAQPAPKKEKKDHLGVKRRQK